MQLIHYIRGEEDKKKLYDDLKLCANVHNLSKILNYNRDRLINVKLPSNESNKSLLRKYVNDGEKEERGNGDIR